MKKIIAFGASNSKESINKKLANYIANKVNGAQVKLLDLNDFEMPIFSVDRENENGIHELAYQFKKEIIEADGIVISLAEHNGAYSAAFKNIYDWVSRISSDDVWEGKPMFLAATSPGSMGGKTVMKIAKDRFKRRNSNVIVNFSLPYFSKNYSTQNGITDVDLNAELEIQLKTFEAAIQKISV